MSIISIITLAIIFLGTVSISKIEKRNHYYDLEGKNQNFVNFLKALLLIGSIIWISYTSYDIYHNHLYHKPSIKFIKTINI